jgi:hypothetical protein
MACFITCQAQMLQNLERLLLMSILLACDKTSHIDVIQEQINL